MRALRSHAAGGPETLVLDAVEEPLPGPGEVVIAVEAAALNYPDVLLIQDLYQARPPRPFSPGSEVAGRIDRIGSGVTRFKIGDPVIGVAGWGGLADKLLLPERACTPIRAGVPMDEAAALIVTYATAYYALKDKGSLGLGETLIVLGGAGGVGLAAVQLGKAFGATVVAAVSSEEKAVLASAMGADATVIYGNALADRDGARAFTQALKAACPRGAADVILDPIGGDYAEPAFRALGWQGRHLVVGFTAGIPRLPLNLTLLKGASVVGVFYGDFTQREPERCAAYLAELTDLHAAGRIRPHISMRLPLERAHEGLRALGDRTSTGKIVITF